MAQAPPINSKIAHLRKIAQQMRPKSSGLPLIPIEYTGDEEPTKVERPDTIPPRSLSQRVARGASDSWHTTPKPVQFVAALTALVGALAALAQALSPLLR